MTSVYFPWRWSPSTKGSSRKGRNCCWRRNSFKRRVDPYMERGQKWKWHSYVPWKFTIYLNWRFDERSKYFCKGGQLWGMDKLSGEATLPFSFLPFLFYKGRQIKRKINSHREQILSLKSWPFFVSPSVSREANRKSHNCSLWLGRIGQSVGHVTRKSEVLGSIPGLATSFRFSFCWFKRGSCQLLAKVCAGSTG